MALGRLQAPVAVRNGGSTSGADRAMNGGRAR